MDYPKRMAAHRAHADWWPQADLVYVFKYNTLDEIVVAEIEFIHEHRPLFNRSHKPFHLDMDLDWYCGTCGDHSLCEWSETQDRVIDMDAALFGATRPDELISMYEGLFACAV
jgi:hypothetical protein